VPAFVVFQLLCSVLLLIPDFGGARLILRVATFGAGLVLLVSLRGRGGRHPSAIMGMLAIVVVAVAVMNPDTTNLVAGGAQAVLYLAVISPLFWVPRLDIDLRVIRRVALILFAFHSVSALFGVLQVYYPGRFQPHLSSLIAGRRGYVDQLMIITNSGVKVFRPMGLTDIPGGAAISGLYAILLGSGFFLTRRNPWMMTASAISMVLGVTCLYLSQVRAVLVMTGIAMVVIGGILLWRRDLIRVGTLAGVIAAVAVGGYGTAMGLAGPSVARRVATLTAARPGTVYYNERGHFFYDALTKTLPQAPLGQGLGHWGMMATYFGQGDTSGKAVWVEIQWAGWIVDGGAPLAFFYCAALLIALYAIWKVAHAPAPESAPELPVWATIVLAYGIGAFALTFSYPIFLSEPGMEFWLLNAAMFAAARHARSRSRELAAARAAARTGVAA
jgi:hypothetical protein